MNMRQRSIADRNEAKRSMDNQTHNTIVSFISLPATSKTRLCDILTGKYRG